MHRSRYSIISYLKLMTDQWLRMNCLFCSILVGSENEVTFMKQKDFLSQNCVDHSHQIGLRDLQRCELKHLRLMSQTIECLPNQSLLISSLNGPKHCFSRRASCFLQLQVWTGMQKSREGHALTQLDLYWQMNRCCQLTQNVVFFLAVLLQNLH